MNRKRLLEGLRYFLLASYLLPITSYLSRADTELGDLAWASDLAALEQRVDAMSVPVWTATNTTAVVCYNYGVETVAIPANATLTADMAGWNDGEQAFVVLQPAGAYTVSGAVVFAGYGTWPTNTALCVAWKYGQNIYVNPLRILQ